MKVLESALFKQPFPQNRNCQNKTCEAVLEIEKSDLYSNWDFSDRPYMFKCSECGENNKFCTEQQYLKFVKDK
jgi:hypothetical protein